MFNVFYCFKLSIVIQNTKNYVITHVLKIFKKVVSDFFFLIILSGSISSFAEDVSEFEIEGIKIGDSLLDYMSEEKIKIELERNKGMYAHTDKKFISVRVFGISSEVYEYIVATIKRTGDLNYKIYSINQK